MPPQISVIMSVYNGSRYLNESIASILSQTFTDWEFIIINDGSTDNSESIVQGWQKQDERIKLISRSNKGLTISLNQGLSYAQGQYIARMDADDIALPDRFAKQVAFLDENPDYVAVGCRMLVIDPEGMPIFTCSRLTTHEEIDAAYMAGQAGIIGHPAVMMRRRVLQSIGGYREQFTYAQDRDLFLRLAEVGKLANLPDTLLEFRLYPTSVGHSRRSEQKQCAHLATIEAHQRRGLEPPILSDSSSEPSKSISGLHRQWTWWALGSGNLATARKHALLALARQPLAVESWKVFACALRGW
ncbi:glycosyltransferase family 2 protein [Coleofasciculus sp. E1-EBD-02]|uniref:glycosyltransferase family 2 protein n=1 Tax=Coleofasciculus sp. E1-EBD-02 TaxID=3068481 RepID=UPI0033015CA4